MKNDEVNNIDKINLNNRIDNSDNIDSSFDNFKKEYPNNGLKDLLKNETKLEFNNFDINNRKANLLLTRKKYQEKNINENIVNENSEENDNICNENKEEENINKVKRFNRKYIKRGIKENNNELNEDINNNNEDRNKLILCDYLIGHVKINKELEEKLNKNETEFNNEINNKNKEIEDLKNNLDSTKEELNNEINNKNKEIEDLNTNLKTKKKEFYKEINNKNKEIKDLNTNLNTTKEKFKNEINNKNKEIEDLEKNVNLFKKNHKNEIINKNIELENIKTKLKNKEEEFKNEIIKKDIEIKKLKNDLITKEKELNKKDKELENYKEDLEYIKNELEKIKKENQSITEENSNLKLLINEKKYKNVEITKSLENEKNKNMVLMNSIREKEIDIKNFECKLNLLQEIISSKEKFYKDNVKSKYIKKIEEKVNYDDNDDQLDKYGKIGLYNEQLNCYMSSVIQILKNIKSFSTNIINAKIEDNIIESFQNLLNNLYYSKDNYVSLSEFKNNFSKKYNIFEGRHDSDSTYFLIYLLQYLHKAFNHPIEKEIFLYEYRNLEFEDSENEQLKKFLIKYESKNNSFIIDLFYGYQMNKTFCSGCHKSQISFQSFNMIDLPLIDDKKKLKSLEQCLNCYLVTRDQKGEQGFECTSCKRKLLSYINSIIKLPFILIINLKRVGENSVYYHDIDIPYVLNTDSIEKLDKLNKKYDLIGFIKHYGSEKRGHNIAYTKNIFDDKWYMYNDMEVKEERGYPSTEKAFLLFYQMRED